MVSIVADYRASAGIDLEDDRTDRAAGRRLRMPVASRAQDWGAQRRFDAPSLWRAPGHRTRYQPTVAGHSMAVSHPADVAQFGRALLAR